MRGDTRMQGCMNYGMDGRMVCFVFGFERARAMDERCGVV